MSRAKRDKPHWGARKIRELLVRRLDGDIRVPAKSTIHAVLHRHGLVKIPGRPRHRATGTPLSTGAAPNDLWCADFKGEFKLGNGRYCFPLTVTDHASRFLLLCEALESTRENLAITAFGHCTSFSIPIAICRRRIPVAPASRPTRSRLRPPATCRPSDPLHRGAARSFPRNSSMDVRCCGVRNDIVGAGQDCSRGPD